MTPRICEREEEILAAIREDSWSEDLRAHAGRCEACAETLLVASFMNKEAASIPAAPLPDPEVIWARARAANKLEAARRAVRPIAWMEKAAGFICGAGAVALLIAKWQTAKGVFGSFASLPGALSPESFSFQPDFTLILMLVTLPLLLIVSVFSASLARE